MTHEEQIKFMADRIAHLETQHKSAMDMVAILMGKMKTMVEAEREACAKLAYEILDEHESYDFGVADAIRARGKSMTRDEIIKLIHAWQAIEETSGILRYHDDAEKRMDISVMSSAWHQMDDLVRDIWDEMGRP
jgi:hypothetical protein